MDMSMLLYIKQTANKDPPQSTGTTQHSVTTCMGEESKREWIHVCIKPIHFTTKQCATLYNSCTPIKVKFKIR